MSRGVQGADIERMTQFAVTLRGAANQLETILGSCNGDVARSNNLWVGPDGNQFRTEWQNQHYPWLRTIAQALDELGDLVLRNRDMQIDASQADGGPGGPGGAPGGAGGGPGGPGGGPGGPGGGPGGWWPGGPGGPGGPWGPGGGPQPFPIFPPNPVPIPGWGPDGWGPVVPPRGPGGWSPPTFPHGDYQGEFTFGDPLIPDYTTDVMLGAGAEGSYFYRSGPDGLETGAEGEFRSGLHAQYGYEGLDVGWGTVDNQSEFFFGGRGEGSGHVLITDDTVSLAGEAEVFVGAEVVTELGIDTDYANIDLGGRAFAGAEANASGVFYVDSNQVTVGGDVGAFVGYDVTTEGDVAFLDDAVSVGGELGVAWGLGASAGGEVAFGWDEIGYEGDIGLALGPGVSVGVDLSVSPAGLYEQGSEFVGDFADGATDFAGDVVVGTGDFVSDVGDGLSTVGGGISDFGRSIFGR